MKLGHILVCHSTNPRRAIESIPHREDSLWYVFLHSENTEIEALVSHMMAERNGNIFDYKRNRGLARSWNEGLHLATESGCEAILLLNDDLYFREGGYEEFVSTIGALRNLSRNVSYVTPLGLETGSSAHAGQVIPQNFACCAIMPEAIERIGYFDETFAPAYYEDIDYDRRLALEGMTVHVHQNILVDHERSSTDRNMSPEARKQGAVLYQKNQNYFLSKWGGDISFQVPFNRPRPQPDHTIQVSRDAVFRDRDPRSRRCRRNAVDCSPGKMS